MNRAECQLQCPAANILQSSNVVWEQQACVSASEYTDISWNVSNQILIYYHDLPHKVNMKKSKCQNSCYKAKINKKHKAWTGPGDKDGLKPFKIPLKPAALYISGDALQIVCVW